MGAVQIAPDRTFEVQVFPLIFFETMLLFGERTGQRLANEFSLGLEMGVNAPLVKPASLMIPAIPAAETPSRRKHLEAI